MKSISIFLILGALLCSAKALSVPPIKSLTEASAAEYFKVYKAREDFDRFIEFYADDAVLEDLVYGFKASGKQEIKKFFDWNRGEFSLDGNQPVLSIEKQVVSGNIVVTKGVFNRFIFQGKQLGPWRFLIYQRFNLDGKIVEQEDWINYTPKESYMTGNNLN